MMVLNLKEKLFDLDKEEVWLIPPKDDAPGVQATLGDLLLKAMKFEDNADKDIRFAMAKKIMRASETEGGDGFTEVEKQVLWKWVSLVYPSPVICGAIKNALWA